MTPRSAPASSNQAAPPSTAPTCPVCGTPAPGPFFALPDVPVHIGRQWPTAATARACPRGDIALHACPHCTHVFNARFEPEKMTYAGDYDNALDHSPRFRAYLQALAEGLIDRYDLHGTTIMEIGAGNGAFLSLLARLGDNRGVGFDPSSTPEALSPDAARRVTLIPDYYTDDRAVPDAALICGRHVLEHVPDPVSLLRTMRRAAEAGAPDAAVYVEVPNLALILDTLSVWDVIYEHVSYFSLRSLATAVTAAGLRVRRAEPAYDRQFLRVEAVPDASAPAAAPDPTWPAPSAEALDAFQGRVDQGRRRWTRVLDRARQENERTVLWGAGAKAVGFMHLLDLSPASAPAAIVDINPHKQGAFLPGSGLAVVPPTALTTAPPAHVIVMNPIYKDEIRSMLDDLDLHPTLHCAS